MGEPQLDGRRAVFLGRPASSSGTPTQPNFMFQLVHTYAAGHAGHLAGLDRLHQQSAHDERDLQSRPAPRAWPSAGARRRWPAASSTTSSSTTSSHDGPLTEFFDAPNTSYTPRVLKDGVGFGRRARRAQPRLSQHRPVQRGMAAALQPVVGGKPITPIEIAVAQKNSAYWQATEQQTPLTALFFLKAGQPDRLADAPGGRAVPDAGCGAAGARQDRVRRDLRALPFEQGARRRPRASTRAAAPARTTCSAGTSTGPGPRPTSSRRKMRDIVQAPGLPRRQLPVDRFPRAGDAAADQRLQPARDQRDRRQHLGQLLLADLQEPAVGRARSRSTTRSPASRASTRCRPAAAATRARRR